MTDAMTSSNPIVLIVEDEPIIRMNAADYVADFGIEPLEAATADEALAILGSRPDIDVVFTDVNMPGSMDGLELSRLISERWPRVGSSSLLAWSALPDPAFQEISCSSRSHTTWIRS
jgi:CheY-like chemotaxis protein